MSGGKRQPVSSAMADASVPSLSRAREEKISELSTFFANDDLSLEDLERRIERVYKASSVSELDSITADLNSAASAPPDHGRTKIARAAALLSHRSERQFSRVFSIMSSTRRVGRWAVPQRLEIVGIMTDTKIDLTRALLPAGIIDVDLRVIMSSFKLVVPPSLRVVNDAHSVLSNIRSHADELPPEGRRASDAPVIRLTGVAVMSDVSIVVRRRQGPAFDGDD